LQGAVTLALAAVNVVACGHFQGGARRGVVNVVGGGNIAAQIGGPDVKVTSILTNPNGDPHLYEASARDAPSAALAGLVIANGGGYLCRPGERSHMTAGVAIGLRAATLRFGRHTVWEGLDLDIGPGEWPATLGT
jgi:Zinc-uptake complex component A periplasmic